MLNKPVLHYFNGRGRAEIVRLTLATAGIDWTEVHLNESADFKKLKNGKENVFENPNDNLFRLKKKNYCLINYLYFKLMVKTWFSLVRLLDT